MSSAKLVELKASKIDMPKACFRVFLAYFTVNYSTQGEHKFAYYLHYALHLDIQHDGNVRHVCVQLFSQLM